MPRVPQRLFTLPLLAGLLLTLTACGDSGIALPADVLDDDAVAVLHIDATRMDEGTVGDFSDMLGSSLENADADRVADALDRAMGRLDETLQDFKDAGGTQILWVVKMPDGRGTDSLAFLVRAGSDADPDELLESLQEFRPDRYQFEDWVDQSGETWYVLQSERDPVLFDPGGADDQVTAEFNQLLEQAGDRAIRIAARPSDDAAEQLVQTIAMEQVYYSDPRERDRVRRSISDLELPDFRVMQMIDGVSAGFQPGSEPSANVTITCDSEASATRIARILDGGTLLTRTALAALSGPADDSDLTSEDFDAMEEALQFEQDDETITLTLTAEQWQTMQPILAQLGKAMEGGREGPAEEAIRQDGRGQFDGYGNDAPGSYNGGGERGGNGEYNGGEEGGGNGNSNDGDGYYDG